MSRQTRTPLAHLLTANISGHSAVYSDQGKHRNREQWLTQVRQWRSLIAKQEDRNQESQNWALFHSNSGEFSAMLLALWSMGKRVYLPASAQPQVLEELSGQVDYFIGDFDYRSESVQAIPQTALQPSVINNMDSLEIPFDEHDPCLYIYTSGSSGEPQAIGKSLSQLESELQSLYHLWADDKAAPFVVGTVSHQHIYGLLFRVLLPLTANWCFDASTLEFFEQLREEGRAEQAKFLISSPTHLSRIPKQLDEACAGHLTRIFSSGAPLPREASLNAAKVFRCPVIEVYGSSETGGIGWRQQTESEDAPWRPLPGVAIRQYGEFGCLEVNSGHLPHKSGWYSTADKISLIDQTETFRLLGRIDRIAKIEGKRISLDGVEKQLRKSDSVADVRVIQLDGSRTELGAIVVLNAQGKSRLQTRGKRHINLQLKTHLREHFELPLLPRRWRYLDQLPFNNQGKLALSTLKELFVKAQNDKPILPEIVNRTLESNELRLSLKIPENLLYFDGHFDKAPILPGVVQLHWAQYFAQQAFQINGEFKELQALKFQKIAVPLQNMTLEISNKPEKGKVHFSYYSEKGQHSSGRIVYGSPSS